MNHARRGDQLVGRIALNVEARAGARDFRSQRPDMDPRKHPNDVGIVEVHGDPPQLSQLRNFPEDDRRNAPAIRTQESLLALPQRAGHGVKQDVGVNVQHPNRRPWTGCRP